MKRAIIIHGWNETPEDAWFQWLRKKLKEKCYKVDLPLMPDTAKPAIAKWVGKLQELKPDQETVIIAHSIGCQTTMRYLMAAKVKIKGAVFVGGWVRLKPQTMPTEEEKKLAKPWLATPLDWEKIKQNCSKLVCIFSNNDPYVLIEDAEVFLEKLNAKIIIEKGLGHMGAEDNLTEFPLVLDEVEELNTARDELYKGFWVDYYEQMFPAKDNTERAKLVIDLIKKFKPNARKMLELACGTGNYTVYWMKCFNVKATDLSEDMLAKARKKCPGVTFQEVSMTEIKEPAIYDVVTCMWESFRYLDSFKQVDKTLQNIHKALKSGGIFITDFHHFPAKTDWTEIKKKKVKVKGIEIQETLRIKTEGNYDVRATIMKVKKNSDMHTEEVKRAPFLRISKEDMRKHLEANGFQLIHIEKEFQDSPYSMLFVARKE